ncbi:hypothetical protein DB88DRAFT_487778 [Papiliotrema laurentii]|uniref:ATP synthase subunit d, mitochondrial n=1 Tax=Papiliotrema laurentii TaxID=5418 RepID=A0AAD9FRZ7_PAPLA|nr:hypothetical protein DB88DRAFT_487778 [Papiliotrema laurentii]
MASRSAAAAVDWTKIYTQLGLGKETLHALQSFRARHTSAVNRNAALKASTPQIDLSHYRNILKDTTAIAQAEKVLAEFKAVDYDVKKWDEAVASFESKAVTAAKETVTKIASEETSLNETLSNIKDARPFEDLTIHDISKARPDVQKTVDTMLQKGKWSVPGYRERFGEIALM